MAALPDRLGKYHVLERIAQGGMAEIYKAKTVGIAGFEKILALKRISPSLARENRFIRSFVDEARIAVTLNHRNIVQVFDFGKHDGELYLAMELIEGVDLRSATQVASEVGEPVPAAVACSILAEVASGLDYAHSKTDSEGRCLDIVHCDVSPQNVMLSYDGFVKILDFGVARARFSNPPKERRLRGKPRYMAPEQTRGLTPTPATDVFALGILAWELLTGLPLFEGSDLREVLEAVRRADAPPVSSLNPDVPESLSEAIASALHLDPDMRCDAGVLAIALARNARELSPVPSSRAIADWLDRIYDEVNATVETTGEITTELSAPEPRADESSGLESTTSTINVGEGSLDGQEDPTEAAVTRALGENRRVVATAIVIDGGAADTRRELRRMLADLAYKHGAVIHSQTADSVVAIFGLEIAGEDDIAHAMQYSLDAVELARTARSDRDEQPVVRIATRAGITAQRRDDAVKLRAGAIDEALALTREAEPGHPLLTGGTGRLASAQFSFRELPARRHRRRRLRVLELIGPRDFGERARALRERRGRFIGRASELAELEGALDRAHGSGRRQVVCLAGAAGIGKSRLIAEFLAAVEARTEPPAVVEVAASPIARHAPFWLVGDLLHSQLDLPPRRGQAARGALVSRLRHLLSNTGLDRSELDESVAAIDRALELRDGADVSPDQAITDLRERITGALRSVRRALPGQRVVVIEDIHLADATSIEVLRAAMPAGEPDEGELVVMTTRGNLGELPGDIVAIGLDELDQDDRDQLIRDRLAGVVDAETVATVTRRAGGNPLFIEELASAVHELGSTHVPSGLRDVLMARFDRLPAACKAVLQHAAVVGPVFRSRILEELLGLSVHKHLQELVDEGLVVRADFGTADVDEGELAFRHVLLQEVVYESLAVEARRQTHTELGKLLASRLLAGRDEPPLLIARHLELGGELERAAELWLRAGQVALAAYDATEALSAFDRVLELDNDSDEQAAVTRRMSALFGREQANRELGHHDAQARDLAQLEGLTASDPGLSADVRNRKALRFLRVGDYGAAIFEAEAAEQLAAQAADARSRGEALRLLGEVFERTGEFERGLEVVERAIDIFRSIDATRDELRARIGIGRNHLTRSRYEAAWATYEPILEHLADSGDPWLERVVRNHVAVIHLCKGEFEAAMASARRSMELCDFYGDRARSGDNLSVCGIILTEVGQLDEARGRFRDALGILEETGSRWSRADCQVYAGSNEASLDNFDRALQLIGESITTAQEIGARYVEVNGRLALAGVYLRRAGDGDAEAALEAAEQAAHAAHAATLIGSEIAGLSRAAEAHRRLGQLDLAVELSRRAVALLDEQRVLESSEEHILFVHHRILAERGDPNAGHYLALARDGLDRKLSQMTDPTWRESFIDNIEIHRAIRQAQ